MSWPSTTTTTHDPSQTPNGTKTSAKPPIGTAEIANLAAMSTRTTDVVTIAISSATIGITTVTDSHATMTAPTTAATTIGHATRLLAARMEVEVTADHGAACEEAMPVRRCCRTIHLAVVVVEAIETRETTDRVR
jgi:hypothetical protein